MSAEPQTARKALIAEAAHWLSRTRSGEMNAGEMREFEVWRSRDPAHASAYSSLEGLWGSLDKAFDDPQLIASRERDERRFDRRAQTRFAGMVTASATLAALSCWAIVSSGVLVELELVPAPRAQELRTGVGQRTTVTLRDGSIVTLDTDSLIRLRETMRTRRIELVRGQAFFQVAKDHSRPFIVAAAGKTVRATGTAFDVRVDGEKLQVTLVEGRVRVQAPKAEGKPASIAEMRAGWRLVASNDDHWNIQPVDLARETSWHEGRLAFFRDPLERAVSEMNRYSKRKIVFRGPVPKTVVVGVFETGDMDAFVRALELNRLARVAATDKEKIELTAR